ncbi:MAG: serine hydrolase [Lachnospiraceae bacterium]|nr:serine hydrolase [Lachnospiraceae bacterium]
MINKEGRIIRIIFVFLVITLLPEYRLYAATRIPENIMISVDGGEAGTVRAINASYDNNIYISLRDTAFLMAESNSPINVEVTDRSANITVGEKYSDEFLHEGWSLESLKQSAGGDPGNAALSVNGEERRYYTILAGIDGYFDCFISPMDLAMILDISMDTDDQGNILIETSSNFIINPARMESNDYFDGFNTVVVGDATTGEVFYGYNYEEAYPIASTTKLMTYLITMDAIADGTITPDDKVVISKKAADLSASSDGFVALSEGWEIPISELILGALLPSSNECALSLAEYIAGSEKEFVELMNKKCEELQLKSANFHNSNGLPIFTESIIPAKTQNKMSGYDMFKMCSHILNTYPQIKDITSMKTAKMPTLNRNLKNTNLLLYNLPEVNGLKTGTTDRSGACLITSLTVPAEDGSHDIVVVTLGAENSQARLRVSELMARYGINVIKGKASKISYDIRADEGIIREEMTSELIVRTVVDYVLRN